MIIQAVRTPPTPNETVMRRAIEAAPRDSYLAQSSRPGRVLKGALLGAAAGAGGAFLGQSLTQGVLGLLPGTLQALPGLQAAGLAAAAGAGAVAGALALVAARGGDHTPIQVVKTAARSAGRFQGALVGAVAGAAMGVSLHPAAGLPLALAGAWVGQKLGGIAGGLGGTLATMAMKSDAGTTGSRYHHVPAAPTHLPTQADHTGKNAFTLLPGDAAMTADVMQEIAAARKSIHFETYLLNGEDGKALCDLLIQKKKEGLEVKVLLDPFFQKFEARMKKDDPLYQMGKYLEENGVEFAAYPLGKLSGSLTPSEHAKILVVDDNIAYVGGTNIDDTFNHDVNVKITGPAAADIRRFFDESWAVSTHEDPDLLGLATDPEIHCGNLRMFSTGPSRSTVRQAILDNIRTAAKSIHVEMFTLTDDEIVDELKLAQKRGVDVKLLLCDNKEIFHLPTFHIPNLPTAIQARDAGLDVRYYANDEFTQMHSKLAIFDGKKVMIGSANWIHHASRGIHEYYAEISDPDLAQAAEAQFAGDWNNHGVAVEEPNLAYRALSAVVEAIDDFIF